VVRHREEVKAAERGRNPWRTAARIGLKWPVTGEDADFVTLRRGYAVADFC
jgi:hypothetical protein